MLHIKNKKVIQSLEMIPVFWDKTTLHVIISQKTGLFFSTAVRTSNLKFKISQYNSHNQSPEDGRRANF